ncbi:MAG TPA: hypothetical protein VMD58_01015 [Acidobacteriaceae bacterium]|nr:hypothetical protein [Acidobacteriaceae bacterium]
MEKDELYFRILDQVIKRENFLEKEMLDAEVHHLEVRTGFFDKLAILAAGSLAVGISFITAGYERNTLKQEVHTHLCLLTISLGCVLLSLIACVVNNFLVSRAVELLSSQVEWVYKAANQLADWYRDNPGRLYPLPLDMVNATVKSFEGDAEKFRIRKLQVVKAAEQVGSSAVLLLMAGYIVGITTVLMIVAQAK